MKNNFSKDYNEIINVLNIFTYLFFAAGIILPIVFVFQIGLNAIDYFPSLLIPPLYLGFILIVLSGLSYIFSAILSNPSEKTQWIENTMKIFGYITIVLGIIGFILIISKTNNSHSYYNRSSQISNASFIIAIAFLLINSQIGLLCLASSAIYNKYLINNMVSSASDSSNSSKVIFCQYCGEKIDLYDGLEYCPNCKKKLQE